MGTRFRKSKSISGVRVTASKSGLGMSVGGKGYRFTKKAGGGYRTTASIPGTGVSYVKDYSGSSKATAKNTTANLPPRTTAPVDPRIKRCKTAFGWFLGLGIFFMIFVPYLGIILIAIAIFFSIKKNKIAKKIAAGTST